MLIISRTNELRLTFLKKILLVDYEPRVTAVVRRALEETGKYLIKAEHDSRLAMNAARWFQPDLILFDVNLTNLNGSSMARQLQADPEFRDTPEWDEVLLGDLFDTSTGGTPDRTKSEFWSGSIPWITTSLVDFNVIANAEEFICFLLD